MADLGKLLEALEDEARAKQAEVQAARQQLLALQRTHHDTLEQVDTAKDELAKHRASMNNERRNAQQWTTDAQQRAGAIIAEADKMRRAAEQLVQDGERRAAALIAGAQHNVQEIERDIRSAKAELQTVLNEVNAGQSRLAAIKKQALDFGNSA